MSMNRIIGDLITGFGVKAAVIVGGFALVDKAYAFMAHAFDPIRHVLG